MHQDIALQYGHKHLGRYNDAMARKPTPHKPRKRFGQNFLTDQGIISRIVKAIHPLPEDHLVEIGPGQGALTEHLAPVGCQLDVIELDRDLVPGLLAAFSIYNGFKLHSQDALTARFPQLVQTIADHRVRKLKIAVVCHPIRRKISRQLICKGRKLIDSGLTARTMPTNHHTSFHAGSSSSSSASSGASSFAFLPFSAPQSAASPARPIAVPATQ